MRNPTSGSMPVAAAKGNGPAVALGGNVRPLPHRAGIDLRHFLHQAFGKRGHAGPPVMMRACGARRRTMAAVVERDER